MFKTHRLREHTVHCVDVYREVDVLVQETGEGDVQSFVTGNHRVCLYQTGHETALTEPENGSEGRREENALDYGKDQ